MKVQAVACDLATCDSVAKPGENGVPASWLTLNVAQGGRKLVSDAVFCSQVCVVSYMRDLGDIQPRRRRRTKEQIEADAAAAAAAESEPASVPETGTVA
jgi:hypothetical protein